MKPLVSIAIAAYNVEQFLRSGIKYIQNQTYSNIEIILVDDGSTDNTPVICEELAKEDDRIRVFHKPNGGLGSARNVGIKNAQGEYLYFFDVDDSLDSNYICESVSFAEEKKVDLIIYSYYARFSNSTKEEYIGTPDIEIHNNEQLKEVFCNKLLWMKHGNGFVWNKFYRLSFLKQNNILFGNLRIQQDEPFNLQIYPLINDVYICSKAYYHYILYVNNNAGSRYLPDKTDIVSNVYNSFMKLYLSWNLNDKAVIDYIYHRYVSGIFNVVTCNYFHKDCHLSEKERYRIINNILNNPELLEVMKYTSIHYGNNPINNIQAWAFNHRKTGLLIWITHQKDKMIRIKMKKL